jgi:hypothetical protein
LPNVWNLTPFPHPSGLYNYSRGRPIIGHHREDQLQAAQRQALAECEYDADVLIEWYAREPKDPRYKRRRKVIVALCTSLGAIIPDICAVRQRESSVPTVSLRMLIAAFRR